MRRRAPWLALLLLVTLVAAGFALGLRHQLSWRGLAAHQAELHALVAARPVLAAVCYVSIYAGLVAVSLPLGGLLTVTGGWLFGAVAGGALAAIAAVAGATLLFLLARGVLAPPLARRAGPWLDRLRAGLQRDGFAYLLALRFMPVVPFWVGNLAPALAGMRLAPFVAATALGIVPATATLAWLGAGLGGVLARDREPDLSLLTTPTVLLPLCGLSALSLVPVLWRRGPWRRWRRQLP